MRVHRNVLARGLTVLLAAAAARVVCADPTPFTYQGELRVNNAAATGTYDLRFRLYDAATGGTQLGAQLAATDITPLNGIFSVDLDFGSALLSDATKWLEVEVSDAGAGSYTVLTPRTRLSGSPFAHRAGSLDWSRITNKPADFADDVDNGFTTAGTGLTSTGGTVSLDLTYYDSRYYHVGNLSLNGDAFGNVNTVTVAALRGRVLANNALNPSPGQVLTYRSYGWDAEMPQFPSAGSYLIYSPGGAGSYAVDVAGLDSRYLNQNILLSGDTTGVYNNNTVSRLQGRAVSASPPAPNSVLKWTGIEWAPGTDANNTYTAGTGLTLTSNQFSVNFTTLSTSYVDEAQSAGGDATGTFSNLTVDGLQGRPVSSSVPAVNDLLRYNGAQWVPSAETAYTAGTALTLSGNQFSVTLGGITSTQLASDAASLLDVSGGNMRISSGNVGVGSGTPTSQLHVFGNTVVTGSLTIGAVNRHWAGAAHNWTVAATSGASDLVFTSNGWNGPSSQITYVMQQDIHLPHGATVTAIEFSAFDNNGNNFGVDLIIIPINGTAPSAVASVASSSSASGVRLFSNVANHTVDNVNNAYGLRATWNTGSQPANMRLHGVHIVYSTTTGLP